MHQSSAWHLSVKHNGSRLQLCSPAHFKCLHEVQTYPCNSAFSLPPPCTVTLVVNEKKHYLELKLFDLSIFKSVRKAPYCLISLLFLLFSLWKWNNNLFSTTPKVSLCKNKHPSPYHKANMAVYCLRSPGKVPIR